SHRKSGSSTTYQAKGRAPPEPTDDRKCSAIAFQWFSFQIQPPPAIPRCWNRCATRKKVVRLDMLAEYPSEELGLYASRRKVGSDSFPHGVYRLGFSTSTVPTSTTYYGPSQHLRKGA